MKNHYNLLLLILLALSMTACGQTNRNSKSEETYTFQKGDPNGIGKWYMGREIAHVMGYQGINWLERSDREKEENTSQLLMNMNIQPDDTIADIGAGSGYHTFKMAKLTSEGFVYAVDIQPEMLQAISTKQSEQQVNNIQTIQGSEKSINLDENSVSKILLVDVYHEFNFPKEMIESMHKSLTSDGKIYLIEYKAEDESIPIKEIHKMSEKQAVKEFKASGFKLEQNIENLPWQHCLIFVKE
ncbi:class I SAM-dependent methyltransferase [Christiangramia sp. OXR-203]|uniref:class I SAM-dependent methyltransferase n=1 Tax=Christiangramia sp. OXR-203 TaxID=3100176 RepID=UPI002AC9E0A0|nr:class I SAM-dependent methyltransferase [Christiangramia sp. OXR-203]WPY97696.1 class I SAM-dependent methyltransferase [Christiangramia sp. OXR-203]